MGIEGYPSDRCVLSRPIAAKLFVYEVAEHFGVEPWQVCASLAYLPDDRLDALDSPRGWHELAGQVAAAHGKSAAHYWPSVH
jgi:hypothetical protein